MNKKISTLLAAFLAAGFSLTAEAGVVKVTNPKTGNSYVIAEQGWDASTAKSILISDGADVKGKTQANMASIAIAPATDLWQYTGSVAGFTLLQTPNGLGKAEMAPNAPAMRLAANASTFVLNSDILTAGSEKLTFSTATAASWGAGTAVDFYAYTAKVAQATGQILKVGNKYLVVNPTSGNVELADESTYQSYLTLGMANNTLWDLDGTSGKYSSKAAGLTPGTDDVLAISGSGATLGTTAAGSVFESNTAEGLFGIWDAATAAFSYLQVDGATLKTSISPTTVTIVASAPAVAPPTANTTLGTHSLATTVVSSEYYLISSNDGTATQLVLAQANNSTPATFAAFSNLTTDEQKATAYWKVNETKVTGGYKYSFVNKAGVTLKVGGVTEFFSASKYAGGITLEQVGDATKTLQLTASGNKVELASGGAANVKVLGFYNVAIDNFTAAQLCQYYNTYFDLQLKNWKAGAGNTDQLQGNMFEGGLVPMEIVYNSRYNTYVLEEAAANAEVFLLKRKADGAYIVMDWDKTWSDSGINNHVTQGGFKFDKLSEDNLRAYINGYAPAGLNARHLAFAFSMQHANLDNEIKYISVVDYTRGVNDPSTTPAVTADDRLPAATVQYPVYLTTFEANGTTYLTVNAVKNDVILYASLQKKTLVHGSDAKNNPLLLQYVNIKFANHPSVNYTTEDGRRATLNGKVLGMRRDNGYAAFPAEAEKFLFGKPEGQWVVKMTNVSDAEAKTGKGLNSSDDVAFTFVNRESGVEYNVDRMFWLGGNTYAVEGNSIFSNAQRDTLEITGVDMENNTRLMDGYKNYSDADLQDVEYRLVMNSTSDVDYYVSENHKGNHLLGITTDKSKAVTWRVVRMDRKAQMDVDGYVKYATDSVYIVHHPQKYMSDGKYYADNDTLALVTYALQNTENGEYMTYEDMQSQDIESMACEPKSENFWSHYFNEKTGKTNGIWLNDQYRFVVKEKDGELVNILGVSGSDASAYGYRLDLGKKLYGASTKNTVEVETAYTQINSNDLFRLERIDAPVYRKAAQDNVIRIFREENNQEMMYENGKFLNLGNKTQLTDIAPAIYVDTAYMDRGNNTRYQYLLVVNPKRVDEVRDNAGHVIKPDTTYGRFLVNMIDSAVYTNKHGEIHNNIFINDKEADETYVKTGFVWGYRTKDKLYLTNGKDFSDVKSEINLGTPDFNIAKFAFRYVNPSANDKEGAFNIQTRYVDYNSAIKVNDQKDRYESNNGYLKTINGVVVITEGIAKGEEFNLAAESSAPVSNEDINASSVEVIAGNGIVTIKGAADKKVVITNVLGQTIASTVISSDNAIIAAPQGVVVVAVEGEAAVKAIVK
ncbi:DUF6383 domain-containing protein [Parabacteroides gordonii]|uniref:DUF6383 domain-containing protein n=1 Tax=Parabacteroides gordonii TaxID=574930 RepID=UPI0026ECEBF9|nr:DUF6383 domain-containing protein [Parabacteroides gordonii]